DPTRGRAPSTAEAAASSSMCDAKKLAIDLSGEERSPSTASACARVSSRSTSERSSCGSPACPSDRTALWDPTAAEFNLGPPALLAPAFRVFSVVEKTQRHNGSNGPPGVQSVERRKGRLEPGPCNALLQGVSLFSATTAG